MSEKCHVSDGNWQVGGRGGGAAPARPLWAAVALPLRRPAALRLALGLSLCCFAVGGVVAVGFELQGLFPLS